MELSRHEMQQAVTLALQVGTAADREEFARRTMDGVRALVPSDIVSYNEIQDDGGGLSVAVPDEWVTDELMASFWACVGQHPLIRHYAETSDGRALKISDFLDRHAFHELDLYREFFALIGVEYQMAITLPAPAGVVVGVALNRRDRDYSERERALLNLLRPLLTQAYVSVAERAELRGRVEALDRGLGAVEEGIVVLHRDGSVDYCSPVAAELLRAFAGDDASEGGRLPAPVEQAVGRADGGEATVERDGRTLRLRPVGGSGLGVLVLTTGGPAPPGCALSPRQLEILASVADGRTNREIAAQLGLSPRTIEKHLQNAFDRLGARTRAAAVARVFGR